MNELLTFISFEDISIGLKNNSYHENDSQAPQLGRVVTE